MKHLCGKTQGVWILLAEVKVCWGHPVTAEGSRPPSGEAVAV